MIPQQYNRLFFAIPAPEEIKSAAENIRKSNAMVQGVRWVPLDNMHITVLFLGNVLIENIPDVIKTLDVFHFSNADFVLDFEKFSLEGGKGGRHSMVWARFFRNNEFTRLTLDLREAMLPFFNEPLKFHDPVPHITLARLKSHDQPNVNFITRCSVQFKGMELWKTNQIPGGVRYESLSVRYLL